MHPEGGERRSGAQRDRARHRTGPHGAGQDGGGRVWLDVPFAEKDQAKQLGARWDPAERRWYAGPAATAELLARVAGVCDLHELPEDRPGLQLRDRSTTAR